MSVMGPVVLQKKSSARTILPRLSLTSNPPKFCGGRRNFTPLVSIQGIVWAGNRMAARASTETRMRFGNRLHMCLEVFISVFPSDYFVGSSDYAAEWKQPPIGFPNSTVVRVGIGRA